MSYSFDLSDDPDSYGTIIQLKRTDGPWKDSPQFIMPYNFLKSLKTVKNFEIFEDDIWLTGCFGTKSDLLNELVWLMKNNLDYVNAQKEAISERFYFFEKFTIGVIECQDNFLYSVVSSKRQPRFYRSHLPAPFLPEQIWSKCPKLIHVSRDPKEAAKVHVHQINDMIPVHLTEQDYYEMIMEGKTLYGPYLTNEILYKDLGKINNYSNILYLTYEEVVDDLDSVIQKLSEFLGKNYTEKQIKFLKDYLLNLDNNSMK